MTMDKIKTVLDALDQLNIEYKLIRHEAVSTIEEMDALGIFTDGEVCKNLFLRNANGKIHYLVCCLKDKKVDLVDLRSQIGSSRLSFGSDERLMKHLGLTQGAVSPFGIINNEDHQVQVVLDKDIMKTDRLVGFHPNDNTGFVWLKAEDLIKFIKHYGNDYCFVNI